MTTQEITVRIAKTIQEQQYEPITVEVIIKEACPKKKYGERVDELIDLASEKVFGYLTPAEEVPEGEEVGGEEYEEDPDAGEEGLKEEDPDAGEEGFEEEGQGEEGLESSDDEFGDFFEDDPGGEE